MPSFGPISSAPISAFDQQNSAPPDQGGTTYATQVSITFESRTGALRANLTGMKWYVWAQVGSTPLEAPIAQGVAESTDSAGVALLDITGQTSVLPGAPVLVGFTNQNGDPAQAGLISWFGVATAT